MERTKTIDFVATKSNKDFVNPCNKICLIVDTIFKENFVRSCDVSSILYEPECLPFKQFIQNAFGKYNPSKDMIGHIIALLDKIVSTTNYVIKQNNINRILIGLLSIITKYYRINKFLDKMFEISINDISNIENEVNVLIGNNASVDNIIIKDYSDIIYKEINI